jgi:hypothetical protein
VAEPAAPQRDLAALTPADFLPLVGQTFRVVAGETGLEVELVEVRPLPPHRHRAEPFALTLRGPRQPVLTQRVHTLVHPALGQLALFLVPVQGGGDGVAYEAIFN